LAPVSQEDLLNVELLQKAFGGHRRWASIYPFWEGSEQQNISQGLTIQVKWGKWDNLMMNTYERHRFPPDIISYTVWLYYRFNLSHRDIEDLLAERGLTVSHESIRLWWNKFGPKYARRLKRKHQGYGDTFFIDEVFAGEQNHKINGKQHCVWRAVDQDDEVVDVYLQAKRDGPAAKIFFKRLLRSHGGEPRKIVTDKLRS
jgi:putative transposase